MGFPEDVAGAALAPLEARWTGERTPAVDDGGAGGWLRAADEMLIENL
jgi:hypothetical protein